MGRLLTRRTWLKLLAIAGIGSAPLRNALAAGSVERGVYRVRGDARVNDAPARPGMEVRPGDTIATGRDGEIVFVVTRDAFLVRPDSRVEITGRAAGLALDGLRMITGRILSVFEPGQRRQVRTATATIGIRGTGIYIESDPGRTYACTCYGEAELVPVDDPKQAETVRTRHHDQPRYIYPKGMPRMLEPAPVENHTDAELVFLESLVGRRPPFEAADAYGAPR